MSSKNLPLLGYIHPKHGCLLFIHEDGEYSVMDLAHRNPNEKKFLASCIDLAPEAWNWLVKNGFEDQIKASQENKEPHENGCFAKIDAKCYALRKKSGLTPEIRIIESIERRVHHEGCQVRINWAPEKLNKGKEMNEYQKEMQQAILRNQQVVTVDDETRESFIRTRNKEVVQKQNTEIEQLKRELQEEERKIKELEESNAEDVETVRRTIEAAEKKEQDTERIKKDLELQENRVKLYEVQFETAREEHSLTQDRFETVAQDDELAEERLAKLKAENSQRIANAGAEVTRLENERKLNAKKIEALQDKIAEAEREKNGAKWKNEDLERTLSKKKDDLSTKLKENDDLKAEMNELGIDDKKIRDEGTAIHLEAYHLELKKKEKNEVNQENGKVDDQLEALEEEIAQLKKDVQDGEKLPDELERWTNQYNHISKEMQPHFSK